MTNSNTVANDDELKICMRCNRFDHSLLSLARLRDGKDLDDKGDAAHTTTIQALENNTPPQ